MISRTILFCFVVIAAFASISQAQCINPITSSSPIIVKKKSSDNGLKNFLPILLLMMMDNNSGSGGSQGDCCRCNCGYRGCPYGPYDFPPPPPFPFPCPSRY